MAKDKEKKSPIVNRWWFWILILLIAAATASSGGNKDSASSITQSTESPSIDQDYTEREEAVDTEIATTETSLYKIGVDLPAGDYYIRSQNGHSHFAISSGSTEGLGSIIIKDNFSTHTLVTVSEGQYLEVTDAAIIPLEEAPALVYGTKLSDGMYRVGQDLPAGEYKITLSSNKGYYQVSSDMTHTEDSIISNNTVEEDTYLKVSDGQILKLSGITLILE